MTTVNLDEGSLREGLLGLVVALVEIIAEVLRGQALRRMEAGGLAADEVEALGRALRQLDETVAQIKEELGLAACVETVRRSLDRLVEEALLRPGEESFLAAAPGRW